MPLRSLSQGDAYLSERARWPGGGLTGGCCESLFTLTAETHTHRHVTGFPGRPINLPKADTSAVRHWSVQGCVAMQIHVTAVR